MEIIYRYRLHLADIALFVGLVIFFIGFAVFGFCFPDYFVGEDRYAPYIVSGVGVLTLVMFVMAIPKWVGISREWLVVRTMSRTIRIPLRDIVSVVPCQRRQVARATGVRIGGVKLSVGKYHNSSLGSFEMVTTDTANMVLITTRNGRKLIINSPLQSIADRLPSAVKR